MDKRVSSEIIMFLIRKKKEKKKKEKERTYAFDIRERSQEKTP